MTALSDERFIEHLEQVFEDAMRGVAYLGVGVKAVAEAAVAADRAARAEPVVPDYDRNAYEELRSIIDGGSESMTHADAVEWCRRHADADWMPVNPAAPVVPEGWNEVMDMLTGFYPIVMTSSSYGGSVFRVELGFRNLVDRNKGHDFLLKLIHFRDLLAGTKQSGGE